MVLFYCLRNYFIVLSLRNGFILLSSELFYWSKGLTVHEVWLSTRFDCPRGLTPQALTLQGLTVYKGWLHKGCITVIASSRVSKVWTTIPQSSLIEANSPIIEFWKISWWVFRFPAHKLSQTVFWSALYSVSICSISRFRGWVSALVGWVTRLLSPSKVSTSWSNMLLSWWNFTSLTFSAWGSLHLDNSTQTRIV
jgi:hypothetical protein